jgi:cytochrome P450
MSGSHQAPGPEGIRGLTAAVQILRDPRRFIDESARRYGRVWATRIPDVGWRRLGWMYWLMGPEANERILAPQHKDDFSWYGSYRLSMEPIFGRDILFLSDDTPACPAHRDRHRRLAPSFHPQLDAEYVPLIAGIVDRHLAAWGTTVDLQWEIKRIAFHVVARLFFGAEDDELPELVHDFEELGLGLFSIIHLPVPGSHFFRGRQARKRLARFLERKIALLGGRSDVTRSVLAQLLKPSADGSEPLSNETLISEMMTFLFAGYDTTASLMTSLFAALGENKNVRGRVVEEVRSLAPPSSAALPEMPELDRTLLETERLYPPLIFAMRSVKRSFTFRGIEIPAGEFACYSPYYTGRMPELWDAPLEFRPERFAHTEVAPYTLLAFGGGWRTCIGKRFARMEATLVAAAILRRFDIELLPGRSDDVYFNPTLQRKHGLPARVLAR